jgi:molybdopterin-guanine dinucleotide biosynthesis protein A
MTRIAAAILAGGKGERLGGVTKALLEIGGRTLLDRARDAIIGCDPVVLSVGRTELTADGMSSIADLPSDYAGPLAGVAATVDALLGSDAELLLTLAVDTPFFPVDFIARALPMLADAPAVIAAYGPQDYPTNGLWRLGALRSLPAAVRDGSAPHSLKRLAITIGAVRLDYAEFVADDPFRNVNTPEDLAFLRRRAGENPAG